MQIWAGAQLWLIARFTAAQKCARGGSHHGPSYHFAPGCKVCSRPALGAFGRHAAKDRLPCRHVPGSLQPLPDLGPAGADLRPCTQCTFAIVG